MFFRKKKEEVKEETMNQTEKYDESFKTQKIKVFITIVSRGQGQWFLKKYQELEAPASFLCFGKGTVEKELYAVLGITDTRKDIIFTIANANLIPKLKEAAEAKFNSNKNHKGVAFAFELNSVAGVLAYKYLSNTKENVKKERTIENGNVNSNNESSERNEPKRRKTL